MHSQQTGNSHSRKHHPKTIPQAGLLQCMIIGNDSKNHLLLRDYIAKTPRLHLSGKFEPGTDSYQQAAIHKVDIIFWDTASPENGLALRFKETGHQPLVVCLSDGQEELETDVEVFGYLEKPISLERFLDVVKNIKDYLAAPAVSVAARSRKFIFVKSEYKIIKVLFEDILFCEGMKDYTQVYLKGKTDPILTLNNLKLFSSKLPADEFIRVHRSYIVSISHIDSIARNEIYVGKKIIPVGDSYKEDFYQLIESNS